MNMMYIKEGLDYRLAKVEELLEAAMRLLGDRYWRARALDDPKDVVNYLQFRLAFLKQSRLILVLLDARQKVIEFQEVPLFKINAGADDLSLRKAVQVALNADADSVILAHNCPEGDPKPSEDDRRIARELKQALAAVKVRVLNYFTVAAKGVAVVV